MPANTVDVNVHPTKLEVRFSDDNLIYDIIYNAVLKALKNTELIPEVTWDKPKKIKSNNVQSTLEDIETNKADINKVESIISKSVDDFKYDDKPILSNSGVAEKLPEPKNTVLNTVNNLYYEPIYNEQKVVENTIERENIIEKSEEKPILNEVKVKEKRKPFFNNYRIVGQLFATYWIVEQNNCMYLIDQHAAHERALYEDFTEKFKNSQISSQQLLQPIAVNLSESEKVIVEENIELLESFGFEIEEFGARTYAIRAVPYVFNSPSNVSFFMDIVDTLADKNLKSIYDTKEDAIAMMSCKAAVKGNDRLSYSEAQELIQRLLSLEDPFTCPHGRPTIIEMTKYELEKKFKRIQD